jgi:hypothetical protein
MSTYEIGNGRSYVIGDAVETLREYEEEAAIIFLDDAWARPERRGQFGVEYDTHPFDEENIPKDDSIDTSVTTVEILKACKDALVPGGWLIADADDWLLPRLVNCLRTTWGDVAETYRGGGYRKVGGVTYVSSNGKPDKSTAGMYLSTGGYPVVFAHKGETDRRSSVSARQIADRQTEKYEWGSVKPLSPYVEWIDGLVEPGELVLVPCAGTAPGALAAERVFGSDAKYVCIDNEEKAYQAFSRRRDAELESRQQETL